jgi:hypothetical protein
MARKNEQMKIIEGELAQVRAEIERLKVKEETLLSLLGKMGGEGAPPPTVQRTRSPNIKPLVLEIMHRVGFTGATTAEVDREVREKVPTVAKETVGSILSRLKSFGALTYDGVRYYEKQFTPKPPFEGGLRAVS